MKNVSPKLPLTAEERKSLRAFRIKLKDLACMEAKQIADVLSASAERANYLRALAQFQSIPSIGPKMAEAMVALGYLSLEEVRGEDGADLLNRYEQLVGYQVDPCVEDCFRCIVHHAGNPQSRKSWFDFTEERKSYRSRYGYPANRPAAVWHQAERKT